MLLPDVGREVIDHGKGEYYKSKRKHPLQNLAFDQQGTGVSLRMWSL